MSNGADRRSESPLSCEQYYKKLQASCMEVLEATFAVDADRLQAASHSFVGDLQLWVRVLTNRPEAKLLQAGLREYQFALLAVVQGQYRPHLWLCA
jgi:hypothetical protein